MQKKQVVIKGLFFVLFGIIGFSSFTFAQYGVVANGLDACAECKSTCGSNTEMGNCTPEEEAITCETQCAASNACAECKSTCGSNTEMGNCTPEEEAVTCKTQCASENPTPDTKTVTNTKVPDPGDQTVMGITMGPTCLKNGQCGLSIYDLLGMKGKNTSATIFVQDVLLSATLFIGTIITIALIYSGIMYIMAGVNGKDPSKAKNGITYSIIGLLLVISSYTIIRLVQYIAKGL